MKQLIGLRNYDMFAKIKPKTITKYLQRTNGWELVNSLDTHDIWINKNHKDDWEDVARFDVHKVENDRGWGWACFKGCSYIAQIEQWTMLDALIMFDACNVSDLFTCVDPSIDGVFKCLMKPQGTIAEGFQALREAVNS